MLYAIYLLLYSTVHSVSLLLYLGALDVVVQIITECMDQVDGIFSGFWVGMSWFKNYSKSRKVGDNATYITQYT